ncbi:DNA/RNA helicase, DEAD/DEAH box type, N-terminal domain and Helicase, superfamily 1/2, ATP-binding domain and P-loop containing nucleoside triphosphate hydrolase domain-containing protein [Strongyloides ratti]|uniref:ATP-dependent RNA helicase n=1 Tax=Strongyloides ratti TaxID=34506 RepID=A0A090MZ97_STRRB|nr:DNA/RNA helicase, DEAD/DEAH box type, N-terminal domain and Helicase, superfamily 1/2, ATP-binding domain and P-loop containing nucleoside triphosphate hydrolase domain-containing protein [Strongyloides ratti]CEF68554.1 DNA/RNA helicase, DEAD/DEAH box type, N-terminal domain and Helicase, superfamily 1/2, ATP-binding domain and P-loop containing nucleoside triphosphate hydrolase domain-containing protein [Strongyloides ratti]
MAYQQYNNVRPHNIRHDQNEINDNHNNRGFNNQNKGSFQFSNNHDYDFYNQNYDNEIVSRGGFDMKSHPHTHKSKTCSSSGSFGIVKGDSADFKCFECSKTISHLEKMPFSFKNLQGIDSIQPFIPKHLEKRNGFTMFNNQNESNKNAENFEKSKCEEIVKADEKEEIEQKLSNESLHVDASKTYKIVSPEVSIPISSPQKTKDDPNYNYFDNYKVVVPSFKIESRREITNYKTTLYDGKNLSNEFEHKNIENNSINDISTEAIVKINNKILEKANDIIQSPVEEKMEITSSTQETRDKNLLSPIEDKFNTIQVSLNKNNVDKVIDIVNNKSEVTSYFENENNKTEENNNVRANITSESYEIYKSWLQINCDEDIINKIIETGYKIPEEIISLTVPTIYKNRDLIFEIVDGQSKYVSFLIPIVDDILKNNFENQLNEPIALILSSSKESVVGISKTTEILINNTKITFAKCFGQYPFRQNLDELKCGCNILASTPGRLIHFLKSGDISLKKIKYLIIDDVNKMLECGFHEIISNILNDYDCSKKENRVNIATITKFSPILNDLLGLIIKDTYTMILKNTTDDLFKFKVRYVEGHINIFEFSKLLTKKFYEMKKNKNSRGISLYVDIPNDTKDTISFDQF